MKFNKPVATVCDGAFGAAYLHENTILDYVSLPYHVTSIGDNAFSYCIKLLEFPYPEVGDELESIGEDAFSNCVLITKASIPNVTSLGKYSFAGCYDLQQVVLSSGLQEIPDEAFAHCHDLTDITLPEGLKYIDVHAFYCCYSLTSITLPSTLEGVGFWADNHGNRGMNPFAGCTSLTQFSGGNNTALM